MNKEKMIEIRELIREVSYLSPVTCAELAQQVGLNTAVFRSYTTALTKEGWPIGSDGRGFFWADSIEAKKVKLSHLLHRRAGLDRHIRAIEDQILDQMEVAA